MSLLKKLLSKLHLSELAFSIEKCFAKSFISGVTSTPPRLALNFLESQWHFTRNSSICEHDFREPDCDLEIIVPCYNVEKYVEECIDSILSQQTKYSFFITIINDGSTDNTGNIITKYADLPNVRIINQANSGLSGARNAGIAQAHGKYLFFIDSDDIMCEGTIETLMRLAFENDADVVDSAHIRFADRSKKNLKAKLLANIYDALQKPQALTPNNNSPIINGYSCGKALKTALFNRIMFPLGYWFEDTIIWMLIEPQCKRKVVTDKMSFRYRMNPQSITHTSSGNNKAIDSLYITLQLLADREALGIEFDLQQYDHLLNQMRMNFFRVSNLSEEIKQAVFVIQQDLIANKFANWTTNTPSTKPIEQYLRSNDYNGFKLWCKWH